MSGAYCQEGKEKFWRKEWNLFFVKEMKKFMWPDCCEYQVKICDIV